MGANVSNSLRLADINTAASKCPIPPSPSFLMSLNHTLTRYLPRLQDVHIQSKEFHVLTSFLYQIGIGLLATLFLYRYLTARKEKGNIRQLGGFPVFTAWTFFTKRYDFIWSNFESDPSPHFKFNVLQVSPLSAMSLCPGLNIGNLRSTV
jgi:hypothetical protein